jgi:hypothetical protein
VRRERGAKHHALPQRHATLPPVAGGLVRLFRDLRKGGGS